MSIAESRPKKILAVDDEQLNLKVLDRFLKSFGFEPTLVDSGEKALTVLDPSFDLVLLDVQLLGNFNLVADQLNLPQEVMPEVRRTAIGTEKLSK